MKVYVKIKPEIAKKGSGFSDIEGKQEIRPYEKGKLVPDKKFELESTPFVESKISTGELILLKREEKEEKDPGENSGSGDKNHGEFKVFIDGKEAGSIKTAEKDEKQIKTAVYKDEKIRELLKGRKVDTFDINEAEITITLK